MTEKEKMLAGMIYDANYDKELMKERIKAKDLCFEYNYSIKPSEVKKTKWNFEKTIWKNKKKILQ